MLLVLLLVILSSALSASAAPPRSPASHPPAQEHAPQITSYRMNVRLDPASKTVSGAERITYQNPSQDTLPEIWLRLYLRAFRDLNTVWMRESGGQSRGFPIKPDELGDITVSKL